MLPIMLAGTRCTASRGGRVWVPPRRKLSQSRLSGYVWGILGGLCFRDSGSVTLSNKRSAPPPAPSSLYLDGVFARSLTSFVL